LLREREEILKMFEAISGSGMILLLSYRRAGAGAALDF